MILSTPNISPIRQNGGLQYVFSSVDEDMTYSYNNDDVKIRFSHYVLLKIPDLKTPNNGQNYMQLRAIPGAFDKVNDTSNDINVNLAESFQNYCLNLEKNIQIQSWYNRNTLKTVSEKVFWKWLKETGAIRFREANPDEVSSLSSQSGLHFVEEDESESYSRVVKQIGDIHLVNSSNVNGASQAEVYYHIPSNTGASPTILFYSDINDVNWKPNRYIKYNPINNADAVYNVGRNSDSTHPNGLSMLSFYDSPVGAYTKPSVYNLKKKNKDTLVYDSDSWWFKNPTEHSYMLEPTMLNDYTNDDLLIESLDVNLTDVYVKRSRLDGINVSFDLNNYAYAQTNKVETWQDFNSLKETLNFDFNAMLVYYDVYRPNSASVVSTNLHSVYFINKAESLSTGGGRIKSVPKTKYSDKQDSAGIGYSFRVNTVLSNSQRNAQIESVLNENHPYSMQLFQDALTMLKQAATSISKREGDFLNLIERIGNLEDMFNFNTDISLIKDRISVLESSYQTNSAYFNNSKSIMSLIDDIFKELKNIYNNKTSLKLLFDTNILGKGYGTNLRKNGDRILIDSYSGYFSIDKREPMDYDRQTSNSYDYIFNVVDSHMNIIIKSTNREEFVADKNVNFYIDDSKISFKNGQIIKIVFSTEYNMNKDGIPYTFRIFTDSNNILKKGAYGHMVAEYTFDEFRKSSNKPIIELICSDNENFVFESEKIR